MDYTPFPELTEFGLYVTGYNEEEKFVIQQEAYMMGLRLKTSCGDRCTQMTPATVFRRAIGGGSVVQRDNTIGGCISNGIISCNSDVDLTAYIAQGVFTHEVGHVFGTLSASGATFGYTENAIRDENGVIIAGMDGMDSIRSPKGYRGQGGRPYVQHNLDDYYVGYRLTADQVNQRRMTEEYADMFLNWVWNSFDNTVAGDNRFRFMDDRMHNWAVTAIFRNR
jgi:hypothetical protein